MDIIEEIKSKTKTDYMSIREVVESRLLDTVFGKTTEHNVRKLVNNGMIKYVKVGGKKNKFVKIKRQWIIDYLEGTK